MVRPHVLLVNPPIYDFTAFDFWLRPYGMFRVAGRIAHACDFTFFDFLEVPRRDPWGRGKYRREDADKPPALRDVPRKFGRFGVSAESFRQFLSTRRFDAILIQTSMTYWYPGLSEVIETARSLNPGVPIILGGGYATFCAGHASKLGADLVIRGACPDPLWSLLGVEPLPAPPFWPENDGGPGVIKLTEGCPFRCSYCAVPVWGPAFSTRPIAECLSEVERLVRGGYRQVAFYDDALLYESNRTFVPFLLTVIDRVLPVTFHTPNALNARLLTEGLSELMVRAGFRSFYIGLESCAGEWLRATGGKVTVDEFREAVRCLRRLGAGAVTAYVVAGHPDNAEQELDETLRVAHESGARVMLSEFSPVPGTPDGERCRQWVDMDEPLNHNKTAFTVRRLGSKHLDRLKDRVRALNAAVTPSTW